MLECCLWNNVSYGSESIPRHCVEVNEEWQKVETRERFDEGLPMLISLSKHRQW
jgi:hypothetical protein